jgi:Na+/proline symporter
VKNLVWKAFEIVGLPACALLGVFLFGLLSRRRANRTNIVAMVLGSLTTTAFWILIQVGTISMAWTWLIVIGTGVTFVTAMLLSKEALSEQDNSF